MMPADGAAAWYVGQAVACEPDGSSAAAYCTVEAPEIATTCCQGATDACTAISNLPTCSVQCVGAWLLQWQHLASGLGQFNSMTAPCEAAAEDKDEQTIGAKRAWGLIAAHQQADCFCLTARTADGPAWTCRPRTPSGRATRTCLLGRRRCESKPAMDGRSADSIVLLDPGFTLGMSR